PVQVPMEAYGPVYAITEDGLEPTGEVRSERLITEGDRELGNILIELHPHFSNVFPGFFAKLYQQAAQLRAHRLAAAVQASTADEEREEGGEFDLLRKIFSGDEAAIGRVEAYIREMPSFAFHGCSGAILSNDPDLNIGAHAKVVDPKFMAQEGLIVALFREFKIAVNYGFIDMEKRLCGGRYANSLSEEERLSAYGATEPGQINDTIAAALPHVLLFDARAVWTQNHFDIRQDKIDEVIKLSREEYEQVISDCNAKTIDLLYVPEPPRLNSDVIKSRVAELLFAKFLHAVLSPDFAAALKSREGINAGWFIEPFKPREEQARVAGRYGNATTTSKNVAGKTAFVEAALSMAREKFRNIAVSGIVPANSQADKSVMMGSSDYDPGSGGSYADDMSIDVWVNVLITGEEDNPELARLVTYNDYGGIIPIITERSHDSELGLIDNMPQDDLNELIAERAQYGAVFIIDPDKLDPVNAERVWKCRRSAPQIFGPIKTDAIRVVITTSRLAAIAKEVFSQRRVVVVDDSAEKTFTIKRAVADGHGNRHLARRKVTAVVPDFEGAIREELDAFGGAFGRNLVIHTSRFYAPSDMSRIFPASALGEYPNRALDQI
ncbi:MAG: hypothetical protein ABIA66_01935, partial [Candidatus Omnitrophota bacterium]